MNDFWAAFFSGCTFSAGIILIGRGDAFLGWWMIAPALLYWALTVRYLR